MTQPSKKRLYRLTIPRDSLGTNTDRTNRNVSEQGTIGSGVGSVENVSVQPGRHSLSGQYRGNDADRLAQQIKELFQASSIDKVAFFQTGDLTEDDGYYTLSGGDTSLPDSKQNNFVEFSGDITKVGTRQSHYRAVNIDTQTVTNTFGSTSSATFGVPADATRTFWYDSVSGSQQNATPTATVEQESAYDLADTSAVTRDVDLFDATSAPYGDDSVLLYDLPYDEEGFTDCGVWDTRDDPNGDKIRTTEGTVALNWGRVFVQDHQFRGNTVFENGRISLEFDLSANTITAEEWNPAGPSWDTIALGTSSGWGPIDVDFTEISEASVRAQVTFKNSDNGSIYSFDFVLTRGKDRVQILKPENAGTPPADLETYLAPIADDEDVDSNAEQGLRVRDEVRL
jgi:hypothetical protein